MAARNLNPNTSGLKRGGPGRTPGIPNKATKTAREMYALLVEANLPEMQGWINRIAEKDPEKAMALMLKASEFHVPKLARTEVSGPNGTPLAAKTTVVHTFTAEKPDTET